MADYVILCLCIITLLSNSSFSLIAPFYPLEVQNKGIDEIYVGFLMGTQAFTFIISSFFSGKYLHRIGRARGMILGVIIIIISIVGLGSLKYVDDQISFIVFSFIWKFLCGVGSGMNSTASFAIIATHYSHEREKMIGKMEASSGIGLLVGPFVGAILYYIGGYMLPFFATEQQLDEEVIHESQNKFHFFQLLKIPRFSFGLLSQTMAYIAATLLQPIMSVRLETEYAFNAVLIGLYFMIPTVIYASTAPVVYLITQRIRKPGVIFFGYLSITFSFLLIGPSQILGIVNNPVTVLLGLCCLGFGLGLIITPIMPDMIESVEERRMNIDQTELNNNISGLFIAFQGIGEALGPILGSVLEAKVGFSSGLDAMSLVFLNFCILYYAFCGKKSIFQKITKADPTLREPLQNPELSYERFVSDLRKSTCSKIANNDETGVDDYEKFNKSKGQLIIQ